MRRTEDRSRPSAASLVATILIATVSWTSYGQHQGVAQADARLTYGANGVPRARPRSLTKPWLHDSSNRVKTPVLETDRLLREDQLSSGGPARVAVVQELFVYSDLDGHWEPLDEGGWLWTMSVCASDAWAARLRIRNWAPPLGAELILYNATNTAESVGPLTASYPTSGQTMWTPIIFGDEIRIEYFIPPGIDHLLPQWQILIDGVVNHYGRTRGGGSGMELTCHQDVTCSANASWQDEADGVAVIFIVNDGLGFICSGFMLNRVSAASDLTPLFATATHCGLTDANAASMIAVWFFESQNACQDDPPAWTTLPQTAGRVLLSRDEERDWTLLGLDRIGTVPTGVVHLGWTSAELDNDSSVVGIHHPRGSHKRISYGTKRNNNGTRPDSSNPPFCMSGSSHKIDWTLGLTEPGSSGSPLFGSSEHVRGVLSCGPTPTCQGPNDSSYGRLDQAYLCCLQKWLDPVDPVYVDGDHSGSEIGTLADPFNSFVEGIYAVIGGSDLFVETGAYHEAIVIDKPMRLNARNGSVVIGR